MDIFPLNLAEIVTQDRLGFQGDVCMPKLVRTQGVQEIKAGVGVYCSFACGISGDLWPTRSRRWGPGGMWGVGMGKVQGDGRIAPAPGSLPSVGYNLTALSQDTYRAKTRHPTKTGAYGDVLVRAKPPMGL